MRIYFGKQQIVQTKQTDMKMTMKTQSATEGIVEMLLWIGRSPALMILGNCTKLFGSGNVQGAQIDTPVLYAELPVLLCPTDVFTGALA